MCVRSLPHPCTISPEAILKLDKQAYSVQEENGSVTVCVEVDSPAIDTPIDFSFSVLLNTIDGTAGK